MIKYQTDLSYIFRSNVTIEDAVSAFTAQHRNFQALSPRLWDKAEKFREDFVVHQTNLHRDHGSIKWNALYHFEEKWMTKGWGPQAVPVEYRQVQPTVELYYTRDLPTAEDWHPGTFAFFKQYLNVNRDKAYKVYTSRELFNLYRTDKGKSNSGLTGWTDRRKPEIRVRALKEAVLHPVFVDPAVLGVKNEKQKVRSIYMDSFANYFRQCAVFRQLHEIYVNGEFVAWRGTRQVERDMFNFLRKHPNAIAVEGDYESMDTWLKETHARRVWTLQCELLDISPQQRYRGYQLLHSIFTQPLVTPQGMLFGPHSLFSGLEITNDFETLDNIDIQFWFIYSLPWKPGVVPQFGKDFWFVVLGDDVLLWVEPARLSYVPDMCQLYSEVAKQRGYMAKPDKQRQAEGEGFFCKRMYSKRMLADNRIESIYPTSLAALSLYYPRNGKPVSTGKQGAIKIIQVLDNVSFKNPSWTWLADRVFKDFATASSHIPEVTQKDVEEYWVETADWRLRVLGENSSIDIAASPTVHYYLKKFK